VAALFKPDVDSPTLTDASLGCFDPDTEPERRPSPGGRDMVMNATTRAI
jgi:hypothetical protein